MVSQVGQAYSLTLADAIARDSTDTAADLIYQSMMRIDTSTTTAVALNSMVEAVGCSPPLSTALLGEWRGQGHRAGVHRRGMPRGMQHRSNVMQEQCERCEAAAVSALVLRPLSRRDKPSRQRGGLSSQPPLPLLPMLQVLGRLPQRTTRR